MVNNTLRAAWAEVSLGCIKHNVTQIKKKSGSAQIIGVVKADGYGHGAVEVSKVLLENDVSMLAVATLDEAIQLRDADINAPIIMLSLTPNYCLDMLLDYNIIPVVASYSDTRALSALAVKKNKTIEVLIAIETGMGRIGLMPKKAGLNEIIGISELPNIHIKGIFSHFATADEKDKQFSYDQIKNFNLFCNELNNAGISLPFKTLGNSASLIEIPEARFDAVRPGIIIYGCYPSNQVNKELIDLKPALSLKASIVFLKKVPAGTSISYGRHFVTERESLIATLPLGYADGYPRFLSGKGRVIVHGRYAPVIGNICMDQCMIDVTDIP
ncbi:MAG TPA: alanine racemase, partial [Anaerovoracaceae bacterium]|nr:alanine racemase [Anaerovoracaceae bacterium]